MGATGGVTLDGLSVRELAARTVEDWACVTPAARPYLTAMLMLEVLDDRVGLDDGYDVVSRFLVNSAGWRGPVARAVKGELRRRLAAQLH